MFISQQLLPLQPWGFLWDWDTSCQYIPENAPSREKKETGGALHDPPYYVWVLKKKKKEWRRIACSISRSGRCSFTTNAIHVPGLYDCMSNQKTVLLLHFIRVNKSLNSDIIGSFNWAHVLCFVSFKPQRNEKALFRVMLPETFFSPCGTFTSSQWKPIMLNVSWFATPLVLRCYFGFCLITTSMTFAIIRPLIFCHNWSLKVEQWSGLM